MRFSILAAAAVLLPVVSASAEHLHLAAGDVLIADVVERSADVIVIQHELLGRVELPADSVVSILIGDAGVAHAAIDATAAPVDGEPIATALGALAQDEGAAPEKTWKTSIEFGVNASYGNTDTQNLHGGFVMSRENEQSATTIDGHAFYGKNNGVTNESRITAGIRQDWFVAGTPWLYFAQFRYDYDNFQSWLHRVAAHAGVGYQFIEREDFTLVGRAGLGAIREWESMNEDVRLEGLLGLDMTWQITDRQSLNAGTTYYPDFDESGEFRTISYADWALLVDEQSSMSLKFGVLHEYQSRVAAGRDNDDFRVYGGLQIDF